MKFKGLFNLLFKLLQALNASTSLIRKLLLPSTAIVWPAPFTPLLHNLSMPETLDCCNRLSRTPFRARFPFSRLLSHDNCRGAACDEMSGRDKVSESIDKKAICFLFT